MSADTNWGCPTKQHLLLLQEKKKNKIDEIQLTFTRHQVLTSIAFRPGIIQDLKLD
jgi:hypothetical protein